MFKEQFKLFKEQKVIFTKKPHSYFEDQIIRAISAQVRISWLEIWTKKWKNPVIFSINYDGSNEFVLINP